MQSRDRVTFDVRRGICLRNVSRCLSPGLVVCATYHSAWAHLGWLAIPLAALRKEQARKEVERRQVGVYVDKSDEAQSCSGVDSWCPTEREIGRVLGSSRVVACPTIRFRFIT